MKSKPAALHVHFLASGFSLPFLSPQKQKANAEVLTVPPHVRGGGGIKSHLQGVFCVSVGKTTVRGRGKVRNIPQTNTSIIHQEGNKTAEVLIYRTREIIS